MEIQLGTAFALKNIEIDKRVRKQITTHKRMEEGKMRTMTKTLILAVAAVFLLTGSAMALAINDNRPLDLPAGDDWPAWWTEDSLQDVFDDNISGGTLDAVEDQSDVALWTPSGDGDVDSYLITMIGGDAGTLGIYSASTGAEYALTIGADNKASFSINDAGALWIGGAEKDTDFGSTFGFYWQNLDNPLKSYTEDDKNTDGYGPDYNILALSYLVPEGYSVYTQGQGGTTYTATGDDWILAFEDRPWAEGGNTAIEWDDGDFNDAVFYVEDIDPVPEPATILLLGAGLVGLGYFGRRKKLV